MDYIINPSWVYWMNTAGVIKIMCLIIGGAGFLVMLIALPILYGDAYDKEDYKAINKWAIPVASVSALLILAGIFIPSKETLITMKVAELATKENITLTAQQLKEIVDYIINAIKELK